MIAVLSGSLRFLHLVVLKGRTAAGVSAETVDFGSPSPILNSLDVLDEEGAFAQSSFWKKELYGRFYSPLLLSLTLVESD